MSNNDYPDSFYKGEENNVFSIVKPSITPFEHPDNDGILKLGDTLLKKVEYCGKIAYKSQDNITSDSHNKFVDMLVNKKHYSVLEHAWLKIEVSFTTYNYILHEIFYGATYHKYIIHPDYASVRPFILVGNLRAFKEFIDNALEISPSTCTYNAAAILSDALHDEFPTLFPKINLCKGLIGQVPPIFISEYDKYHTYHVVTDRGIMAEWTRHRDNFSFTVESTRWCNYDKKGIVFCEPVPLTSLSNPELYLDQWKESIAQSARTYLKMIRNGVTPQFARNILPQSLKSEFMVTATDAAWEHFLKLRTAPDAHPSIAYLAKQIELSK